MITYRVIKTRYANKKRKYWYKMYCGECPVCGASKSYRERQYTPKPLNAEDRYEYLPDTLTYCGCMS